MKIDVKAIQKDRERLQRNLKKIQNNFTTSRLASLLGLSERTWYIRMKSPERFTYGELRAISRFTGIDFAAITNGELHFR